MRKPGIKGIQENYLCVCCLRQAQAADRLLNACPELAKDVEANLENHKESRKNIFIGYLECLIEQEVDAGDHTLFIAKVLLAQAAESAFSNMWLSLQGDVPLCLQHDKFGIYQELVIKD